MIITCRTILEVGQGGMDIDLTPAPTERTPARSLLIAPRREEKKVERTEKKEL